jgi:hypothetical protein
MYFSLNASSALLFCPIAWRGCLSEASCGSGLDIGVLKTVCSLKNVYVLDIHEQTYLYAFPIFQKMLDLLTNSCIFVINMGEDNSILARPHFQLLVAKILFLCAAGLWNRIHSAVSCSLRTNSCRSNEAHERSEMRRIQMCGPWRGDVTKKCGSKDSDTMRDCPG